MKEQNLQACKHKWNIIRGVATCVDCGKVTTDEEEVSTLEIMLAAYKGDLK